MPKGIDTSFTEIVEYINGIVILYRYPPGMSEKRGNYPDDKIHHSTNQVNSTSILRIKMALVIRECNRERETSYETTPYLIKVECIFFENSPMVKGLWIKSVFPSVTNF